MSSRRLLDGPRRDAGRFVRRAASVALRAVRKEGSDLSRRVGRWAGDVSSRNAHVIRHDLGCGLRYYCPTGCDPQRRTVEILRNGDLLFHCRCYGFGEAMRPGDPHYADLMAHFATQEGA